MDALDYVAAQLGVKPTANAVAARLAELFVGAIKAGDDAHGTHDAREFDGSMESLRKLDELLELFRNEGQTPENMGFMMLASGGYLGEVMRKAHGGNWRYDWETDSKHMSRIYLEFGGKMNVNPLGKVCKRLANGDVDSVWFFASAFGDLLKKQEGQAEE